MTGALAGRQEEERALLRALKIKSVRWIAFEGRAGVGKTFLAETQLEREAQAGALVGIGRHRVEASSDDLLPLIRALEAAGEAGLARLLEPQAGLALLADTLGPAGHLLRGYGEGLLRTLPATAALETPSSPRASRERLAAAVLAFSRWLCGFGDPVFILLDDWDRAGAFARDVYTRILTNKELGPLRVLATQRSAGQVLTDGIAACGQLIAVRPLEAESDRVRFLVQAAGIDENAAAKLVRYSPATTPHEILSVLNAARAAGALAPTLPEAETRALILAASGAASAGAQVRALEATSRNAVQIAQLILTLGEDTPRSLLLGSSDLRGSDLETALQDAIAAGVLSERSGRISVSHDLFREALIEHPPLEDPTARNLRACRALLNAGVRGGEGALGLIMLERFVEASEAEDDPRWIKELENGARQMRQMGEAKRAGRFVGLALALAKRCNVAPSFTLLKEAVLAANGVGDHARACARAEELLQAAATPAERAEADELCVFAHRMAGDVEGALAAARRGLLRLGVKTPEKPGPFEVAGGLGRALLRDPRRFAKASPLTADEIATLGPMLRAVNAMGSLAYEHNPALAIVLATKAVTPRVAGGLAAGAAVQAFLCAEAGLYRRAGRWAEVSDALQSNDQPLRAVGRQLALDFGHWHVRPRATLRRGKPIIELAAIEGDLVAASYANQHQVFDALMGGGPLSETAELADDAMANLERLGDTTTTPRVAALRQIVHNLMTGEDEPWRLEGAYMAQADAPEGANNTERGLALYAAMLGAAYGAHEYMAALFTRADRRFDSIPFHSQSLHWSFLTLLSLAKLGKAPSPWRLWLMRRAAKANPHDNMHRVLLLDAERARLRGADTLALRLYGDALESARASGSLLELGIVAEAGAEGAAAASAGARFRAAAARAWRELGALGVLAHRGHDLDDLNNWRADQSVGQALAEHANTAKSRFLAAIGHELRTPLQGLTGLVEEAKRGRQPIDLEALGGAIEQMRRLVGDLLDHAAFDAGRLSIANAPCDLARIVRSLRSERARAGGRIELHLPEAPVVIESDGVRLRQVLSILLDNALTYSGEAVEIVLKVEHDNPGGMKRSQAAAGEPVHVVIEVADRGPGIAPEELARLMEPFERGSRDRKGLGLGLALAHRLAIVLGGGLHYRAREEGGSVFSLRITARSAKPTESTEVDAVLIAEDDALTARALTALLAGQGCNSVLHAQSSEETIAMAGATPIGAAFIDVKLGNEDGLSLARQLRELYPSLSLVLMSAAVDERVASEAKSIGASVLQKPIDAATVTDVLRGLGRAPQHQPYEQGAPIAQSAVNAEIGRLLEAISAAGSAGDPLRTAELAHRLAGLAVQFGNAPIAEQALRLEENPQDWAEALSSIQALHAEKSPA